MDVDVLALIPARGGSKSIPKKNMLIVGGKPLIVHSIDVARAAKRITRVLVSTDSDEIREIALAAGAEAPFLRPAELATDDARDVDYHVHALEWLEEHEHYRPDLVVNLRPTHPVRQAATIDRAIEAFLAAPNVDSLRSVRGSELSPFKMWTITDDGLLQPVAELPEVDEPYNAPRQQLPMVYWQDGYVDITRPAVVLEQRSTTGERILPFRIDEPAVDLDYPDSVPEAERLLASQQSDEDRAGKYEAEQHGPRHPS